ncbi:MAG: universal stress protein [Thermoanaerobaculia bacterium]
MSDQSSFPTLVVGYDGSPDSERAVDWAAELLASHPAGSLHLLEALGLPPIPTQAWMTTAEELVVAAEGAARGRLDARAERLGTRLPQVRTHLRRWLPADSIVELAADLGADLVAVGRRGYTPGRLLVGSVSSTVSRHANCPVVVVRGDDPMVPPRTILSALDGSEPSRRAARLAARLFPDVRIVAAFARPEKEGLDRRAIDTEVAEFRASGARIEVELFDDDPAAALLGIAEREDVDLLTAGRRGRGPLRHLLFGSVAEKLLQLAPTPLLLAH